MQSNAEHFVRAALVDCEVATLRDNPGFELSYITDQAKNAARTIQNYIDEECAVEKGAEFQRLSTRVSEVGAALRQAAVRCQRKNSDHQSPDGIRAANEASINMVRLARALIEMALPIRAGEVAHQSQD